MVTQYYNFIRLGRTGYRPGALGDVRDLRAPRRGDRGAGPVRAWSTKGDPRWRIPAVSWTLKSGEAHGFNLFDVADRLRAHGWLVPAYTLPANLEGARDPRILVRHGFSRDMADLLLNDIERQLPRLQKQREPVHDHTTAGFRH